MAAIEDCDGRADQNQTLMIMIINFLTKEKQDMDSQKTTETRTESNLPAKDAEMSKYGITRSTVDYFHYRDFKYTNLNDALAQARREAKRV